MQLNRVTAGAPHTGNHLTAFNLLALSRQQGIVVAVGAEGQRVDAGQVIARMGSTSSDSVKLHFEIRRNGRPVNPTSLLPQR